ncbi:hypothetical protein PIB30_013840 [Stylosanthes scabra]|uniref:PB1-like domain-containing protein n=1 Tax=Stylosanthes scabra TaxID=79078 RepID=A0ABU6T8I2_9FABA|nr:hypothetical protein [Stylosanthes scabra]
MENFMVPVFNISGKLCEDVNGVLKYSDGEVHSFEALDVDLLSIPVLEDMAKSLGFPSYTEMYWKLPNPANLEFGLRKIKKDSDIIQLRNTLVENHCCVDFEIYFEHPVSIPMMADGVDTDGVEAGCGEVNVDADCVDLDSNAGEKSSSSDDCYESAKDEAYKPPLDGYELSSDNDGGGTDHTSEGNDDGRGKGIGGVGNGADAGCGGKKKRSRKYLGKRKQKSMPDFGPTSSGSGPNSMPSSNGSGSGPSARGDDLIIEEVNSEDGKDYVYESEAFVFPISSDEEGVNKHRIGESAEASQAEEVIFSQSALAPDDTSIPPAQPPATRFRMKQPIVRPPTRNPPISKDPNAFTFMPTRGFRPPR